MKNLLGFSLTILLAGVISCSGAKKILSTTENTALFLPPKIEANVDMFVDEVDGTTVKFDLADSVEIDSGSHELLIRLEYQPAGGSAIIIGGLGNLLLRSATNKTFTTIMSVTIKENNTYRFIVTDFAEGFNISLMNVKTNTEELKHSFKLKEGKFERVY